LIPVPVTVPFGFSTDKRSAAFLHCRVMQMQVPLCGLAACPASSFHDHLLFVLQAREPVKPAAEGMPDAEPSDVEESLSLLLKGGQSAARRFLLRGIAITPIPRLICS